MRTLSTGFYNGYAGEINTNLSEKLLVYEIIKGYLHSVSYRISESLTPC